AHRSARKLESNAPDVVACRVLDRLRFARTCRESIVPECQGKSQSLLFHEILRVRKLAFVEVHIALGGTDVLIAIGVLIWAAIKYLGVMILGGSTAEVWPLIAVSVLIFLVGWDFLPGTGRNAESQPPNKPTSSREIPSEPK